MGIENLNKKNPRTPASSPSATSTLVEVLLLVVKVALGELAGAARRREDQPSNVNANC